MDNMYKDHTKEFEWQFNEILSILDRMNNDPRDEGMLVQKVEFNVNTCF